MADPRQLGWLCSLGLQHYRQVWDWQKMLLNQRKQAPQLPDVLCLLEHQAVYTLGRAATLDFVKFDPEDASVEWHRVERGGEVTYHCPGQLVGYPILNLQRHEPDLHWYLRQLEEVLILVLAGYGLVGERIPGLTGVWVEGYKVAAIGIQVSRWITMHGFALNVCPDLSGFGQIVPCGIGDRPVGSLAQFLPGIALAEVQERVAKQFADCFGLCWEEKTIEELLEFSGKEGGHPAVRDAHPLSRRCPLTEIN